MRRVVALALVAMHASEVASFGQFQPGEAGSHDLVFLVLERARRAGLEAAYIGPEGFEARLSELLAERGIGLVVLAGFLRILSPEFVSGWPGAC